MLYAVRRLHLATGEILRLHTVEVVAGEVCSFFPFDGEKQSMLWVEEAFISSVPDAAILGDIKKEAVCDVVAQPLYLYSCDAPACGELSLLSSLIKLL